MGLPALELLERTEPRIAVIEPDHEAERHLVVLGVIHERAAVRVVVEWPTGGVDHQARLVPGGINLPQLLQADGVALRVLAIVELELRNQLAAQMST